MNKIVKLILLLLVLAGGALTLAALTENCAGLRFCGISSAQTAAEQTVDLSVAGDPATTASKLTGAEHYG